MTRARDVVVVVVARVARLARLACAAAVVTAACAFAGCGDDADVARPSSDGGAGSDGSGGDATIGGDECAVTSDCPQAGQLCYTTVACVSGRCAYALAAYGDPVPDALQTPRDCRRVACDGFGKTTSVPEDDDLPDDGDPCTLDLCVDGAPHATHPPLPDGTPCDGGPSCVAGRCALDAGAAADAGADAGRD